MNPAIQRAGLLLAIVVLGALVATAGMARTELENRIPMDRRELLKTISKKGNRLQVVDVRVLSDDEDDVGGYEDARVPGALPMPGCDPAKVPATARELVRGDIPTVLVSRDGDGASFEACKGRFLRVRNLDGGMAAWIDAGLPEDDGEHTPPSMGAGGGCL